MKIASIVAMFLAFLLSHCSNTNHTGGVSGTYVNQSENEYTKSFDNLVVTPFGSNSTTFIVLSKTGYQKIINGVIQPKLYKQHVWRTQWDAPAKILSEGELGRKFYYNSDKNSLTIQGYEYFKIK
ncbi:hypothetical protein [Mucilaginibacter pedocola]|uniref:Lipoprotein n=1 Tax=Mucilaginibacter pedocola TaxID=1792845 RepID=A0A1S9PLV5_9SPHI|nr:hypothetical protein [Mucilaginibacter pedocola]OOQ61943.1 hypothetical protein BC343_02460 [Mucilaginibacter pedocola]